ncbi:unnamed protein product [Acanthoscelides obtectus]|uniref:EGF-like domain-containing protein n=1 Tax=Acanthoscelides obtectus TaxID=200917 RepID=A0A9P0L1D7_ACAOB|nr:unnamed protein product [Acanthoscelides obtectus]CAK1654596.1 hypothetical protein AOBTE_LOCUS18702 [Acanthoscelides obtectus]
MDDLKLFASSNKQLDRELDIVKRFSEDICMQLGLEKCKRITITRGKISMNVNQITENSAGFDYLDLSTHMFLALTHVGVSAVRCHCPKNFTGNTCETPISSIKGFAATAESLSRQ